MLLSKTVILGVIVIATASLCYIYEAKWSKLRAGAGAEAPASAGELLAESTADPGRQPPLPKLVDVGARKCTPCKLMQPILEELREEYRGIFDVVFIDVWQEPEAARQYRVRLIPTQIFFDASGRELYRHEGFFSKEGILAKWKELGIDLKRGPEDA